MADKHIEVLFLFFENMSLSNSFYGLSFGAALELGRHGWFELRRLIITQEILHLPGVIEIVFLKKPHNWTEELRIR